MYKKRINVLISAYACEPGYGSEREVGWRWVNQISLIGNVWVITRKNNKEVIDKNINSDNINWIYFDLPKYLKFWKKGKRGMRIYYFLWQIGIYFLAKKIIKKNNINIVHHLTFGNYWLPSFLPYLHIPFIWGPIGGAEKVSYTFYKNIDFRNIIYEYLRSGIQYILTKTIIVKHNARKSSVALSKSKETAEVIKKLGASNIKLFSEVGLFDYEIEKDSYITNNEKLKIISVGRLIHIKGFDLGIRAASILAKRNVNFEYCIYGDGPDKLKLEKLIYKENLSNFVFLKGYLKREQLIEVYRKSDILIHPSLHDSGGWTCIEAMGNGCTVICLDIGGPAVQVNKNTGFVLNAINPNQVINDISQKIFELNYNRKRLRELKINSINHIYNNYNWNSKIYQIEKIYSEVLNNDNWS